MLHNVIFTLTSPIDVLYRKKYLLSMLQNVILYANLTHFFGVPSPVSSFLV